MFSHPKSRSKISNLVTSEQFKFCAHILLWAEVLFIQKVSDTYTSPSLTISLKWLCGPEKYPGPSFGVIKHNNLSLKMISSSYWADLSLVYAFCVESCKTFHWNCNISQLLTWNEFWVSCYLASSRRSVRLHVTYHYGCQALHSFVISGITRWHNFADRKNLRNSWKRNLKCLKDKVSGSSRLTSICIPSARLANIEAMRQYGLEIIFN